VRGDRHRVWGTGPIKAVFLHGGPGNSCGFYNDVNFQILDPNKYTVVEIDQLGCGKSKPAVGNDLANAQLYRKVTPHDLAHAVSQVLDKLQWDKVYLHGGSWGSGFALIFAQIYPQRVIGMVIRGIFTGTLPEMDVVYTRKGAGTNPNMVNAWNEIFSYATKKGYSGGENDSKAFLSFFRNLILDGSPEDRDMAAWNFFVQENHVMGDTDFKFNEIDPKNIEEARSVGFFEAHIFYEMLWGEKPIDVLDVKKLPKVPITIVQGKGDDVCPPLYAQNLEKLLKAEGFDVTSYYVEDGHKVTGNNIRDAVRTGAVNFSAAF